ncbi:glycosyltransferase family 2 protein [Terrabacter sp. NPDC000476]|uniref:glycosyltransferase family 2 protein n=1 Tax=Terrabacter sp. NPDC000476 TaxID=3154258 RepID=UPI0033341AAE
MKVTTVPDELSQDLRTPAGAGRASSATPGTPTPAVPASPQAPTAPTATGSAPPSTGPAGTSRPEAGDATVAAVVVVHDGADWLAACLDGLAAQTRPPERLVVVDVASTDSSAAIAQAHARVRRAVPSVELVRLERRVPVGRAIEAGVAALPEPADAAASWVWVLHDDAVPRPTALERLLQAGLRSRSVGIAGPKIVSADDPRRLVEMGIQITRTGRRLASPARGEADQGQYDHRADVLAVSTNGMLVRRAAYDDLGGFDPAFVDHGADLDLGWRAQLAGHRVVVVPAAVVSDATAGLDGKRPDAPRPRELERRGRRAARQVTLARCSPLAAPFLALWMALSAVLASVTLLVAKRPRQAWRELTDVTALFHPVATLGARWRGRRTKRLRRDHLGTLFVAPLVAARTTIDHIQDAITPERSLARREAAATTETGPVADESESLDQLPASLPRRVLTHPGVLATAVVVATSVAAWRDTIRAGALSPTNTGVAGGELRPVTTGSSGLWHAFRDAWHGAGLGTGVDSGPHLAVLSALTWLAERVPAVAESRSSAGVTIAWLLFLTPALATWAAYLAARVVTPSRVAQALAALAWGTAGVAATAVAQGRVTVAVAHVLLPFVLAGFCLAARRDGTFTATFATALAAAVLGSFAPPLLVLTTVAAVLLLLLGPGLRRVRALVLLVVPLALLGPWATRFVDDWRLLLSGPGLVSTTGERGPWDVVALVLGTTGSPGWAMWLGAPVVVLGLVGLGVRGRTRSESVGLGAGGLLAVVGLGVSLLADRVVLGSAETGVGTSSPAHLWSGIGVQLWLAGLLVGLLAGSRPVLAALRRTDRRWRFAAAVVVTALAAAPVLVGAALWGVQGTGRSLSVGRASLPAVALEQAGGPLANRLLLLRPSDDVVDFVLAGQEPGELLRDLDRAGASVDDSPLVGAVADIVGGRGAESLDAGALARLGIGFIQVRGSADTPLARRLDSAEGLSRLGTSEHGVLWKVQPLPAAAGAAAATAPSRARLVDADGALLAAVPTVGPHAAVSTTLPASTVPRNLVLAEPPEWADSARVTFAGAVLPRVPGTDQPTYAVPSTSGDLEIDLAAAEPWWRVGQAALLGLVVFLAVPFGNRRSRRRA